MTYPKGETQQQRIFAKLNQYNILKYKPKGTPKEQAIMNAAILCELLAGDSLQNILSYAHYRSLKSVYVTEQQRLLQNRFTRYIGSSDCNSYPKAFEMPHFVQ